jgi:hypothetical protein
MSNTGCQLKQILEQVQTRFAASVNQRVWNIDSLLVECSDAANQELCVDTTLFEKLSEPKADADRTLVYPINVVVHRAMTQRNRWFFKLICMDVGVLSNTYHFRLKAPIDKAASVPIMAARRIVTHKYTYD